MDLRSINGQKIRKEIRKTTFSGDFFDALILQDFSKNIEGARKLFFMVAKNTLEKKYQPNKIKFYELLSDLGLNFNILDEKGNNVFYYVKHSFEFDYFYKKGVNINHCNDKGVSMINFFPLKKIASYMEKIDNINLFNFDEKGRAVIFLKGGKYFLKLKDSIQDKNVKNQYNQNIAFFSDSRFMINQQLVELGVNYNYIDSDGENIFFKATGKKISNLYDLGIRDININLLNNKGRSMFDYLDDILINKSASKYSIELALNKYRDLIFYGINTHQNIDNQVNKLGKLVALNNLPAEIFIDIEKKYINKCSGNINLLENKPKRI